MNGFNRDDLQAPLAEINMTPLVDVMLVLMVIFLVTAPMLTNSINMNLPNEVGQQISDQKIITVSLDRNGGYYWNDKPISLTSLEKNLNDIASSNPHQSINIRADKNSNYGDVSHILATAQHAGIVNIGFVTEPK